MTQRVSRGRRSWWTALLILLAGACKAEPSSDAPAPAPAPAPATPAPGAPHGPALDIPYAAPTLSDAIEKTFANLQVTPNDDAALAYRVGVPAKWAGSKKLDAVVEKPLVPRSIGVFTGSAEPGGPVIAVTLTRFPFEVPVDAWVRHSLAQQGYTLVAGRYFPGPNSLFFDATATRGSGDQEEHHRPRGRRSRLLGQHDVLPAPVG
jgi:hypothetical protein